MLKIYVCDISKIYKKFSSMDDYQIKENFSLENISEERKVKIMKLKNTLLYLQSIFVYKLLYYAFRVENIDIINLTMKYGKYGKPYFPTLENYFFNLTHSKNYVGVAISDHEVGLDIEMIDYLKRIDRLCKKVFTESEYTEYDLLTSQNDKSDYFFKHWTSKESYLKMTGQGLSKELLKICCNTNDCIIVDALNNSYSLSYINEASDHAEIEMIDYTKL